MLNVVEKVYLFTLGYLVIDVRNSFILSRDVNTGGYVIWYRRRLLPMLYVNSDVKSSVKFRWDILMKD